MNMPNHLSTFERYLAITDVETTGLDWDVHEIIEIGLIVARQPDLKIVDELDVKVKPEHIETADPRSLEVNGYNEEEWREAASLKEAMVQYQEKVEGAIFLAHPLTVDFSFIDRAFRKTGLENPMDYHQLDLFSMAWILKRDDEKLPRVSLRALAEYFGLEGEPTPHRALNGARLAYDILVRLSELNR